MAPFYSQRGQLFDGEVVQFLGDVHAFRVSDGPRGLQTCSFEPPLMLAMTRQPPSPCAVVASGVTFWIQLTSWGMDNGEPYAEGVIAQRT